MGTDVNFLITLFYEYDENTAKVALSVPRHKLNGDCADYPMEPENKAQLHAMLPEHVKSMGPIIAVEPLFSVSVVN